MEYRDVFFLFFDILGFKKMVESSVNDDASFFRLEMILKDTISELHDSVEFDDGIEKSHHWFSDSFIIWSFDNSPQSFNSLIYLGGYFIEKCIYNRIPMRGAMSFGKFYIDESKRTFFGPALIDAYTYAEAQDWIGFTVLPSALNQSHHVLKGNLPGEFSKNVAPFSSKNCGDILIPPEGDTWSFNFLEGRNYDPDIIETLQLMKASSPEKVHSKYDNTIELIQKKSITRGFL